MIYSSGSKENELDRTAQMFVNICKRGRSDLALWLIYDSNRFDADSMKFLAERVEYHLDKKSDRFEILEK